MKSPADAFLNDFRTEIADQARGLGLRRADFPLLQGSRLGDDRFEQRLARAGVGPIDFNGAVRRFARTHLPGFKKLNFPEAQAFGLTLESGAQVYVTFEKRMRLLGKVYTVELGVLHLDRFEHAQLPLVAFYDRMEGGWSYGTADELEATLEEVARLLVPITDPLVAAATTYFTEGHREPAAARTFGALSAFEAADVAADVVAGFAPGCTFLSSAVMNLGRLTQDSEDLVRRGLVPPSASWLLMLCDPDAAQTLVVEVPHRGVVTARMSDEVRLLDGEVYTRRHHDSPANEPLMLTEQSTDVASARTRVRQTLSGLADSPEVMGLIGDPFAGARHLQLLFSRILGDEDVAHAAWIVSLNWDGRWRHCRTTIAAPPVLIEDKRSAHPQTDDHAGG